MCFCFVLFLKQNNGTHLTAVQAGLHTLVTLSHRVNSVKESLLEHFQSYFFLSKHVARPLLWGEGAGGGGDTVRPRLAPAAHVSRVPSVTPVGQKVTENRTGW